MSLLVKNAKFKNTEVAAPEVYVRLQYVAQADGKKVAVALLSGLNKEAALTWKTVPTNLPENLLVEVPEGANQDLAVVHDAVKAALEALDLGFDVTINL
jgi:hypothetical protein